MIEGTDYEKLLNMTDEQAANILESYQIFIMGGRGCGKSFLSTAYNIALIKAIKRLREKN